MSSSERKSVIRAATGAVLRNVNVTTVLAALFVGSLVVIIAMVVRVQKIEGFTKPPAVAAVGTRVLPASARDVNGRAVAIPIGHTRRPVVLYVFSPTCGWCARNLKNIRTLSDERGTEFEFLGISLSSSGLKRYASVAKLPFPLYAIPTGDDIRPLQLKSTPETIAIAPNGRVVKGWVGAYVGGLKTQIENYFDVKLPGLASSSAG